MNTDEPQDDLSTDGGLDAQRDIIRQSLDAIIDEIGIAMRDAGLTFPVYITVRNLEMRSRRLRHRSTHPMNSGSTLA